MVVSAVLSKQVPGAGVKLYLRQRGWKQRRPNSRPSWAHTREVVALARTQEHVWPKLNQEDLIATAYKAWHERRGGRGVRLVGLHVTLLDPQLERQLVLGL